MRRTVNIERSAIQVRPIRSEADYEAAMERSTRFLGKITDSSDFVTSI
jgi:hypothetical protein